MIVAPHSTSSNQPLVTAWVGCYNHARFVIEALESVRLQTYSHIQLIIWDDCSKDNSVELIRNWIQQHQIECTFLPHTANLGLCKSLNEAISLSQGKYCCVLAADDLWLPDRIARQVQLMENAADDVAMIYSDAIQINEQGQSLPKMFIEANRPFSAPPEGFLFDVLFEGNFIPAMTTMIRRECFNHVGGYDEDLCFEDLDMWLRLSRRYKFIFDRTPGAKYRIVATSMIRAMSANMAQSYSKIWAKYIAGAGPEAQPEKIAVEAFTRMVWYSYMGGAPLPPRWRRGLLKHDCSLHTMVMILCASCGISFAGFQKIFGFGLALKQKLLGRPTLANSTG